MSLAVFLELDREARQMTKKKPKGNDNVDKGRTTGKYCHELL